MQNTEQRIKDIIYSVLAADSFQLLLFGSRANGQSAGNSDYDIAVRGSAPVPAAQLSKIRFLLEESTIPFNIDLVDYHSVGAKLKKEIDEKAIKW